MGRLIAVLAVVLVSAVLASQALAARPPTQAERAAILLVFNEPGRSFAAKCVRIRVSTVNRRWAMLTSPRRPPRACIESGQVGDGFVVFRRVGANRWRNVYEGSEFPPCSVPRLVRRDLFGSEECFRQ